MKNLNLTFEVPERPEEQQITREMQLLMNLVELIGTHFRKQRSPAFYAALLSIKEVSLNRICSKVLHTSIHQLIQDQLHSEGLRLLMNTSWSVKHIAYETGYSDPAYFIRCFKKKTGLSPKKFRNSSAPMRKGENDTTMVYSTDRSG